MTDVYICRAHFPDESDTLKKFLPYIQKDIAKKINSQLSAERAHSMLLGHLLTMSAIKKSFNIPFCEQRFAFGKYGKPYLYEHPEVHFNMSHSCNLAAVAVSDREVGIDIEKLRDYKENVAEKYFSEYEKNCVKISLAPQTEYTKIWTAKEAVLKMHGTGLCSDNIKNCLDGENVISFSLGGYILSLSESK